MKAGASEPVRQGNGGGGSVSMTYGSKAFFYGISIIRQYLFRIFIEKAKSSSLFFIGVAAFHLIGDGNVWTRLSLTGKSLPRNVEISFLLVARFTDFSSRASAFWPALPRGDLSTGIVVSMCGPLFFDLVACELSGGFALLRLKRKELRNFPTRLINRVGHCQAVGSRFGHSGSHWTVAMSACQICVEKERNGSIWISSLTVFIVPLNVLD